MLVFAVRNLFSRPVRSALALLGLTVAIVGMVGLFSVAEGIEEQIEETFGRIPGLAVMQVGAPIPLFSHLPADWEQEIAAVDGVAVVNSEIWERANIIDGKSILSPPRFLMGIDIASRMRLKHGVYNEAVVEGRFLSLEDRGTLHAVVSRQIADEFNKGVGDVLNVNGYELPIVGIYDSGLLMLDVTIVVDIDRLRLMSRLDSRFVSAYYVERTEGSDEKAVAARIRERLRGKHVPTAETPSLGLGNGPEGNMVGNLFAALDRALKQGSEKAPAKDENASSALADPPANSRRAKQAEARGGELAVDVRGSSDWAERFKEFSADLDIFLTLMTTIGVTIAVLSIVNTMLMSVTERIIEFGILKANGWSRSDVMRLITAESALLGVGGGLLGAAIGWAATHVVNWYWAAEIHLFASPGLLLFSVGFATVLGVIGGLYPAVWAMRMMPMDAIRRG